MKSFFHKLFSVDIAHAQSALDAVGEGAGLSNTPLPVIIGNIIGVFLGLLGLILLGIVLYAGYTWMTAGGNAEKVGKAKQMLVNAVIGLLITVGAFAITNFIVQAISGQGIFGIGSGGSSSGIGGVSVEPRSGSLGSGVIRDHFPTRGATNVPRNAKIFITFKDAMEIPSFISGYSVNGTPLDVSDDTVTTTLNADNVKIYATSQGVSRALTSDAVRVNFTDNLKTFVFTPPVLGSASENVQYTVFLSDRIRNASGSTVLRSGGYEWSFTVGTTLDLTPPTVHSVTPRSGQTHDRNIVVQWQFSEAVDPTSASGTYNPELPGANFQNLQVAGRDGVPIAGQYTISNEYKTVTFTSFESCGTNSCGETLYCLPGNDDISATAFAATPGVNPPQADIFPYNGVVDMVGNALDGNADSTAGDNHQFSFNTTNNINLSAPRIETVSPAILGQNIALDERVAITFDSILSSDSVSADTIQLTSNPEHELWYKFSLEQLNENNELVTGRSADAVKTRVIARHGVFLVSTDELTYSYAMNIGEGIRNEYQNCFSPAQGPDRNGEACGTTTNAPYCCNGTPSSSACSFF